MADGSITVVPTQSTCVYVPAIVSGLLLYASFFPLSLGFLAWVGLIPFLFLVRSEATNRRRYLPGFVGGLAFLIPAVQWMRVAHPAMYATWLILALYCAAFFPLALYLIRKLDRRGLPLPLAIPSVWVSLEYFRAHFPTGFPWLEAIGYQHRIGFPWYFLGYSQHDFLSLIQIADLLGVYGVSFLVVLVNATLYRLWLSRKEGIPIPRTSLALSFLLLCGALIYGQFRMAHAPFEQGPRVALLQGNVPQDVKISQRDVLTEHYVELWIKAIWEPTSPPDLTIWPETSLADTWFDRTENFGGKDLPRFIAPRGKTLELDRAIQARFLAIQATAGVSIQPALFTKLWERLQRPVLFGLNCIVIGGPKQEWKYNSALLLASQQVQGRYDKMHLVPFGEYVPLKSTLPFLSIFTPYSGDYSCTPGERWTRFPLQVGDRTYHFGCVICYEDTDPSLARRYVHPTSEGPAIDFLVNISNDGWFDGTAEHEEHLAISRFRAIETRRSLVRAVNMGISGIIDADGRIVALPAPSWYQSKKMIAVVEGRVPMDRRTSLYAYWGDWFPPFLWLMIIVRLIVRRTRLPT